MRTGVPCNENLWELTYREFPVSLKGFGFAVHHDIHYTEGPPLLQFPLTFGNWVGRLVQSNFYEFCLMQLLPSHRIQELFVNYILVWKHSDIIHNYEFIMFEWSQERSISSFLLWHVGIARKISRKIKMSLELVHQRIPCFTVTVVVSAHLKLCLPNSIHVKINMLLERISRYIM